MPQTRNQPALRSVALELTTQCNQRCRYCYNAWRADSTSPAQVLSGSVLDRVLERVVSAGTLDSITLTGGEPFLHPEIHDVIDRINGLGMEVTIISNGRCITAERARRLARQRVTNVQLTLAGPDAERHDAACGPASFAGVIEGIRALRQADVPVSGSFLCTAESAPVAGAVFARFAELGIRGVAFNRFNPSGFAQAAARALLPTRTQVLDALASAERAAVADDLSISCTMPIPPCILDADAFPHIELSTCSAGTLYGEPAVSPRGEVRLCTLQRHAAGDLMTTELPEILDAQQARAFRQAVPDFCRGCLHETTCLGGCGAAAEWAFGRADALDPFVAQHVDPVYADRIGRPSAHLNRRTPDGDEFVR